MRLNNRQLQKEADLRYALIQVRENAEAIARSPGSPSSAASRPARRRGRNTGAIISVTRNLGFFTTGYNYLIQFIPLLIVAPLYMRGKVEFGVVTQSAMAFAQVLGAFSLIITQFETLSSFAARQGPDRRPGRRRSTGAQRRPKGAVRVDSRGGRILLERLTLRDPREEVREFVRDLSLDLSAGEKLLVTGPNPQGKSGPSSWPSPGSGPKGKGGSFGPRRLASLARHPLLVPGRLRDQLDVDGPGGFELPEEPEVIAALEAVGLGPVLERLGGLESETTGPMPSRPASSNGSRSHGSC